MDKADRLKRSERGVYALVELTTGRVVQEGEIVLSKDNEQFRYKSVTRDRFLGDWLYVNKDRVFQLQSISRFPDYQIIEVSA